MSLSLFLPHAAAWIAPVATMVAAAMTAANLGARVTGWGFVVFAFGSAAWIVVALDSGQGNLLITNILLELVNLAGIWRWLGRRAVHEQGARAAEAASRCAPTPTLMALADIAGQPVVDVEGAPAGYLVDVMVECETGRIAYAVLGEGGALSVHERLHAIGWERIGIDDGTIRVRMTTAAFARMPAIAADAWPGVGRR